MMDPAITLVLVIYISGWFVLTFMVTCLWAGALKDEHDRMAVLFCILTWPALLAMAVLALPVALGLLAGMLVRKLAKQFREGA